MWARRCGHRKRKCCCSSLDFGYVEIWAINYPTTIEDKSCKNNLNRSYIILAWSFRDFMVILVQMLTP
jgi:hypothetical protein